MPFISIKCYPKDEETKKLAVERINQVMLDVWGCPPHALTISLEELMNQLSTIRGVVKSDVLAG